MGSCYAYNLAGNTVVVSNTLGRVTCTWYDARNRVLGTIANWDDETTLADCAALPPVRDEQGEVISGWLFDPNGVVLEGPEGPVSHLICGGVYDWSTGLIHKDGHYFDPMLGSLLGQGVGLEGAGG